MLLGSAALLFLGHPQTMAVLLVAPLSLLGTVPLVLARRAPLTALATVLVVNSVFIVFGRLSWPILGVVCWLTALALCPILLSRRAALVAFGTSEAVVLCAAIASTPGNYTPWDATLAEFLAVITAWGIGESLRARRRSAAERSTAHALVLRLRERDAAARERAAIARELHDVIAHHISLIAVRAGTAPYSQPGLPEPARAAFEEIAGQARTALSELRTVLGVLRAEAGAAEHSPQPCLADLPDLARRMRDAGTEVSVTVRGRVRALAGSVELCGYRIIQESLTNTGRHAPGSRACVDIDYRDEQLVVTVHDDGAGRPTANECPTVGESGFGLIGMRERVAMLHGTMAAGPDPDGGFRVTAQLPLVPAATADLNGPECAGEAG
ncbi:MAG TPA: histidine kinase [Actinocrinis sp.]|nr:histidine kinase [Actinocrinis sp.]